MISCSRKGIEIIMCLFCDIIDGRLPSEKIYEDEMIYAFTDKYPLTPVHFLIVPKMHITSASEITRRNSKYIARIFEKLPKIAKSQGIDSYRIISNCGEDAGQTVKHLHFHILGGTDLGEKMI